MKKMFVSLMALSLLGFAAASFGQESEVDQAAAAVSAATCPKCGEVAGSQKCCAEGAKLCAACGLNKGSPGCAAKCAPKAE